MEIRTVGVVGLGAMGGGIAQVCIRAGFSVLGHEVSDELGKRARETIADRFTRSVERGRMTDEERVAALGRLETTTQLSRLGERDIVIEAITEDLDAKRALIRSLDDVVRPDALIATNTSALSVTALAAASARPGRVVGMHFFNPAPALPLVEIIHTELADAESIDRAEEFARAIGKEPIRCADTPGFLVNRVLIPLLNDCVRVLDETGVSPEDLDAAMEAGANWPLGPCALVDLIGVDVHVHASEQLWESFREPRMAPPPRLVRMKQAGLLGRKSGAGFYRYED